MKSPGNDKFEELLMKRNPAAMEVLLSKERTLLSHERTAISLGQVALAAAAIGFTIVRFFSDEPGYGWFMLIGIGTVILSGFLTYHAWKDYRHYQKELIHLHSKRGHLDEIYGVDEQDV